MKGLCGVDICGERGHDGELLHELDDGLDLCDRGREREVPELDVRSEDGDGRGHVVEEVLGSAGGAGEGKGVVELIGDEFERAGPHDQARLVCGLVGGALVVDVPGEVASIPGGRGESGGSDGGGFSGEIGFGDEDEGA